MKPSRLRGFREFVRYGFPTILFVVLSSFGLSFFIQGRNERTDRGLHLPENPLYKQKGKQSQLDLEEEYKRMEKQINWDDYVNVRIQRPGEKQDEELKKQKEEQEKIRKNQVVQEAKN